VTYQKIEAELTGVGVKRNILVFRRMSLELAGEITAAYQLASVHEKRNANMVLRSA
jgi:hypothetical protein